MDARDVPSDAARTTEASRFARTIERRWSELLGEAVVLSRRDWACIGAWHARGVPLGLVLELMQQACEQRRGRGRPPRLSSLHAAVEQTWSVVVEGRRRAPAVDEGQAAAGVEAWRHALRDLPADAALAALLGDLLDRLERGEAPENLDAELDERLAVAVPPGESEAVEREVAAELAPYRSRIDAALLERTFRRAVAVRLRRRYDLPRLAQRGSPP